MKSRITLFHYNYLEERHFEAIGDKTNFLLKGDNNEELLKSKIEYQKDKWFNKKKVSFFFILSKIKLNMIFSILSNLIFTNFKINLSFKKILIFYYCHKIYYFLKYLVKFLYKNIWQNKKIFYINILVRYALRVI